MKSYKHKHGHAHTYVKCGQQWTQLAHQHTHIVAMSAVSSVQNAHEYWQLNK